MKVMPVNSEKDAIREMIANVVIDNGYTRVFSLIGTDAGMEQYLPEHVNVVSAEIQKDVFIMQCFLYRQYKLYNNKASYALYVEDPFDLIWLDFFGSAFEGDNWTSVIVASQKLKRNGTLCVTSGHRNSYGGVYNAEAKFSLLGLCINDVKTYINNRMKMSLFTLTKE